MTLVVYADANDNRHAVINRYDNFTFMQIPDLKQQYYQVGSQTSQLRAPGAVTYHNLHPTQKTVHINAATTAFYLTMSESYNPLWRVELADAKVQGWRRFLPWNTVNSVPATAHVKLNDFENSWYVDVAQLCAQPHSCIRNPDGSYDLDLIIEFTPQRWFYVGLSISALTTLACLAYLGWAWRRRRRAARLWSAALLALAAHGEHARTRRQVNFG
jgi:hypothetical protein